MIKRTEKWGIYAPLDGRVIVTKYNSVDYGKVIYIRYADGHTSYQGHNSEILVREGDYVKKGQLIAIMGDTGKGIPKPNKHTHFGLLPPGSPLNHLIENSINPVPWLIKNDCAYFCNTKITNAFQEDYGTYLHEGLDASGLERNLIPGWKNGLMCRGQYFYKTY